MYGITMSRLEVIEFELGQKRKSLDVVLDRKARILCELAICTDEATELSDRIIELTQEKAALEEASRKAKA